ncbi:hypothetical protein P9VFCI_018 [Rhizobium phage P9VFCI]|uniref:Uncharacterized protein n=1 Tax=Rhizobium phage P9VFCI TaxID=2763531 RepID=A0A7G7WXK2_9CAUD|nr:hypothetical protein PP937_gp018 [Rhizobium phage P9VFCI]QNH71946.1 hypothetical protein P9VFCI_018 [Rhizobium phage P9VFCI]
MNFSELVTIRSEPARRQVNFDISWTDNTVNIIPEDAIWNRFVSTEAYEEFFTKLYSDLFAKFKGRPNSETLRREISSFVQDSVKDYQDRGLLT